MKTAILDLLEWILLWAPKIEVYSMAPIATDTGTGVMFSTMEAEQRNNEAFVVEAVKNDFFEKVVKPTLDKEFNWATYWYFYELELLYCSIDSVGYCFQELIKRSRQLDITHNFYVSDEKGIAVFGEHWRSQHD